MNWYVVLENFLANLLAGIVVATIFGVFFVKLFAWISRPKLRLLYSVEKQPANDFLLLISIRNDGRRALLVKEVNWHIYIPTDLKYELTDAERRKLRYAVAGQSRIETEECNHLRELNEVPIFPERQVPILYMLFSKPPKRAFRIFYQFSTVYGLQPRWVRCNKFLSSCFLLTKLQTKNGNPKLELMPFVKIDFNKRI